VRSEKKWEERNGQRGAARERERERERENGRAGEREREEWQQKAMGG